MQDETIAVETEPGIEVSTDIHAGPPVENEPKP
jgi:hypothetical protein